MAQIPSPITSVPSTGGTITGKTTITDASATGMLSVIDTVAATPGDITITEAAAANTALAIQVNGDTNARYTVGGDGKTQWGPGNGATDTNLYRYAATGLATDSTLKLATAGTLLFGAAGDTGLARAATGQLNYSNPAAPHVSLFAADGSILVGGTTALGDNGAGELQLANATTVATTNPTGGALVYASGGGVFTRDPNGTVNSLVSGGQAAGEPTGVIASTCHAFTASATATPTSGTLFIQRIFLPIGQKVSNIGFVTGLTAANGPTHWWTALLDNGYKQQAHSADQLTAAIAASTWQTLAMATPYTATYSGAYFLALMIATSTTQPTVVSTTTVPNAALISGTGLIGPVPGGTSTASLTAPGTDGTTVYATPTAAANFYYMYCS